MSPLQQLLLRSALLLLVTLAGCGAAPSASILRQWCRGGSSLDHFPSITRAHGGYIVTAGSASNDGDATGAHGSVDILLLRLNEKGEKEWSRCYGGSQYENAGQIIATIDGGYLLVGSTASNDGDVRGWHPGFDRYRQRRPDAWIVKLDSRGTIQWQRCLGGSSGDFALAVCHAHDGGYIVAGGTSSCDGDVVGLHQGGYDWADGWVMKLDTTGSIEWQRTLGGDGHETFSGILPTPDGCYIVVGYTNSRNGDVAGLHDTARIGVGDVWVVKLDRSGATLWQRLVGGTAGDDRGAGQGILHDGRGGAIFTARTHSVDGDAQAPERDGAVPSEPQRSDTWIIHVDSSGTVRRQRRLGGRQTEEAGTLVALANGRLCLASSTQSVESELGEPRGGVDGWLVVLDTAWRATFQQRFGGSRNDGFYAMEATSDTTLLIVGTTLSNDGDLKGRRSHPATDEDSDIWIVELMIPGVLLNE